MENRRIADDASADIALTNARKPESLGRGLSVCLGRDLDRTRIRSGHGRNWQELAGFRRVSVATVADPGPAGRRCPVQGRGDWIDCLISHSEEDRAEAKRCHRPEG